jgi:hypothetical protein
VPATRTRMLLKQEEAQRPEPSRGRSHWEQECDQKARSRTRAWGFHRLLTGVKGIASRACSPSLASDKPGIARGLILLAK